MMTPNQKKELQANQRDIELIANRLDVLIRENATLARIHNQQYALRIDECRHAIKGQLNTPLNTLSMIEARERTNGKEAVNNG